MQSKRKESFKLLQLSDDSKSLSELELPETINQRKRKILRKTRNTSPHSRHGHHAHDTSTTTESLMASACTNFSSFSLWTAIIMSCGWLFILSYMTAVVYSENRRLAVEISKLTATSQTVPDELQRWHETSKQLEQNQTAIFTKFMETDKRMENIEKELQNVRTSLQNKYDESSANKKVNVLQSNLANFGAGMKDVNVIISALKGQVAELKTQESETKDTLDKLTAFVRSENLSLSNTTNGSIVSGSVKGEPIVNKELIINTVHNLTDTYNDQIRILNNQVSTINDTLSQRIKGIDDDVRDNKKRLDGLTENVANVTSHVVSIENDLIKLNATEMPKTAVNLPFTTTTKMNDSIIDTSTTNPTTILKSLVPSTTVPRVSATNNSLNASAS